MIGLYEKVTDHQSYYNLSSEGYIVITLTLPNLKEIHPFLSHRHFTQDHKYQAHDGLGSLGYIVW